MIVGKSFLYNKNGVGGLSVAELGVKKLSVGELGNHLKEVEVPKYIA